MRPLVSNFIYAKSTEMALIVPGYFSRRKEPGNVWAFKPFTSAMSSFMWFPLGIPHLGQLLCDL